MLAPSSHVTSTSDNCVKRKSFTVLPAVASRHESSNGEPTTNLTSTSNSKVRSAYHQNCLVPNENFSIEYNAIGSKIAPNLPSSLGTAVVVNPSSAKSTYCSASNEFFARVSSKLKTLRTKVDAAIVTPQSSRQQVDDKKMEKPKFITTVKSGAFLEPPPELAALLGLRKNGYGYFADGGVAGHNRQSMMYSFYSRPRVVNSNFETNTPSRNFLSKWENRREKRDTVKENGGNLINEPSDGSIHYGNTMFDRRVARGSNFASLRSNIVSTDQVFNRQAEARRRAAVRQRAQIRARKLRMRTPPPVDGRKHEEMQTDRYLEELTERPPDRSIACQADLPIDVESTYDESVKNGVDAETQLTSEDLLPENDEQTHSVVTSIVKKILEEAILEINEEIEKFRNSNTEKVTNKELGNRFRNGNAVIITKSELSSLICDIAPRLINVTSSAANAETVKSDKFLENILNRIRVMVKQENFLSDIVKNQLEEWSIENERVGIESESENSNETVNANLAMTPQNESNSDQDKSDEITIRNEQTTSEQPQGTEPGTLINEDSKTENWTPETKPIEDAYMTKNSANSDRSNAEEAVKTAIDESRSKISSKNVKEILDSNHALKTVNDTGKDFSEQPITEKPDNLRENEAKPESDTLKHQIQKKTTIEKMEAVENVGNMTDEKSRDDFETNDSDREQIRKGRAVTEVRNDLEVNNYENPAKFPTEKMDTKNEATKKDSIAIDEFQIEGENIISTKEGCNTSLMVRSSDSKKIEVKENSNFTNVSDEKSENCAEDNVREKSFVVVSEFEGVQENKILTTREKNDIIENRDKKNDAVTVSISESENLNGKHTNIDGPELEVSSEYTRKNDVNVLRDNRTDVGKESQTTFSEITDTKLETSADPLQLESRIGDTKNVTTSENTKGEFVKSTSDTELNKFNKSEEVNVQKSRKESEQYTTKTVEKSDSAADERLLENEVASISELDNVKKGTEDVITPTYETIISEEIQHNKNSYFEQKIQKLPKKMTTEIKNENGDETSTQSKENEKSEDLEIENETKPVKSTDDKIFINIQQNVDNVSNEEKLKSKMDSNDSKEIKILNQINSDTEINFDKSKFNVSDESEEPEMKKNEYEGNFPPNHQKSEMGTKKEIRIDSFQDSENFSNKNNNEFTGITENIKEHTKSNNSKHPESKTTNLNGKL